MLLRGARRKFCGAKRSWERKAESFRADGFKALVQLGGGTAWAAWFYDSKLVLFEHPMSHVVVSTSEAKQGFRITIPER